ncbi:flavin reductase [uncultured Aeromicrobium sp.]|uniref:flavin reductase n=1 Tax=uncultured Aeromicrobium sp. TaxID=337820 RepID=UPI0025E13D8F|nr:flavin reductase [uncultured Aeromicrobium sp.]
MSDFKELVRAVWDAAWNQGDPDALDAIVHPDYELEHAGSGDTSGLTDLKNQIREMRAAIPDMWTTLESIMVDGDAFALFWSASGTFTNAYGDVPPTGRVLRSRGAVQGTLRDGRIIRERVSWDPSVDMLVDLGVPGLGSALKAPAAGELPGVEDLKEFNRKFVTGVTVVTTRDSLGQPRGLAVSAYMPISLEPPLVAVCVQKSSSTYASLFESEYLGINIVANTQRAVIDRFASKSSDKFSGLAWHPGPKGSPLLRGSAASIEAQIKERFRAKTHALIVAQVSYLEISEAAPMVYKAAKFYDGASLAQI